MAFFRSLKSLIRNPKKSRTFLLTSTSSSSPSFTHSISGSPSPPPPPHISRPFFLSNWIVPSFHGPHGPPWKLSQSSAEAPLYVRLGNAAVLEKIETLNFSLLQNKEKETSSEPELASGSGRPEKENDRDDFVNVPNFISLSRMVSGPLLGWMIINDWYSAAMVGLAVSGATDWLDGYVARRMKINSVVGSYLDPLADKVLIGCVALAMVHKELLHPGLVGIIVLRDVGLVGGTVYLRASSLGWKWKSWSDFFNLDGTRPQKVEPLFISKVNTVFQLILVAAALLQPEFGTPETQTYVTGLSWLVASTTMTSTGAYLAQHMRKLASIAPKC